MENNFRLLALLCALVFAGVMTSCEEPEPPAPVFTLKDYFVGERPALIANNSFAIGDQEYTFGSVAAMMSGENLLIVATPQAGYTDAEKIFAECEEYFYGAVSPLLVGKTFDITTEKKLFTVASTLAGAPIEGITPDYPEEAVRGEMTISYVDGKATLVGWVLGADYTELAVKMECEADIALLTDVIYRGNEAKPLRASFYQMDEEGTTLWFTPAGLEHAGELEIATWYFSLTLSNSLLGKDVDITSLPSGSAFAFEMVDNATPENSLRISSEQLQGATGNFIVHRTQEGVYDARVNITIAGIEYGLEFGGECVDYEIRPEVKTNFLTYGKGNKAQEITLVSAAVDCSTDVWVVTLTAANESVLTATVPAEFFTGDAKGFSQSPNLTVSYNERTYSKANGDSGTIFASLMILDSPEEAPRLNFEFMGYDDLSCIYSGDCTLTE